MAQRPYWTGQIRISLVNIPVHVYSAVIAKESQIDLDQLDRETGERIRHINALEDGTPVDREDIVKGYKISSGEYIILEQEEINSVRLPSSNTLELKQFIDLDKLKPSLLEKPFYVLPDGKDGEEIYAVIRDALQSMGKVGVGQITLRGREQLCAIMPFGKGLLMETLRYVNELRDEKDYFDEIKDFKPKADYMKLAKELIKQKSEDVDLSEFHDHYYEAMMELIESKKENREPVYEREETSPKVINLMDALRKSLKSAGKTEGKKKAALSKSKSGAKVKAKTLKAKAKPVAKRKTALRSGAPKRRKAS